MTALSRQTPAFPSARSRGAVLVIVLLTCLGLAALALYFAQSMSLELRVADNALAEAEARQAVEGGARYVASVLTNYGTGGAIPDATTYSAEALKVGPGTFWMIGRDPNLAPGTTPVFGLVDEASKLNLNRATESELEALPLMNADLALAILSWRGSSSASATSSDSYAHLDPPRKAKGSAFESLEELRLVYGADLDLLYGDDLNLNGTVDANEESGEINTGTVLSTGGFTPGLYEYLTTFTVEPANDSTGATRLNLSAAAAQLTPRLRTLLANKLGSARATAILAQLGTRSPGSPAGLLVSGGLTADEYSQIHASVRGSSLTGLVNVNSAPAAVLAAIPGLDANKAAALVAYRLQHPEALTSLAWIRSVLDSTAILTAGPYLTDLSYQFTADLAGVGHDGHGYCRVRFVFDLSSGTPKVVYRRDLTSLGWALGSSVRQSLNQAKNLL